MHRHDGSALMAVEDRIRSLVNATAAVGANPELPRIRGMLVVQDPRQDWRFGGHTVARLY